ncbi:DMT family transporter [Bosea sp. (in: a-proteobacteria)]|jgi:drug/metabolite transporter (DMT)-like permease|uniref:aromatic amino acid exporter YddG n=1 Tax=Bosea sp. (in: a-proteobacteria) TaxID=1871050 RepID=UPI002DDD8314|nr:EamA family transporter [Bosea sp. (in: a-proteobacteria)]HEV2510569.1 EamA family transporter [Bosea sp. (in: a-proteobacteria)]
MTSRTATATGAIAILLWSTLALFTTMSGRVPPFQLVGMTFVIGGVLVLAIAAMRGRLHLARPTPASFLLGLYGPFGDTALYYAAVKTAPAAEANLIHYLWPLLIVLFAALLPGGGLKLRHLVGALIGLAATALLISGSLGSGAGIQLGHVLAALGAFVWASYSVLSRRFAGVPSESLAITMLGCAIAAFACHLAFETTLWAPNAAEWGGVLGLGLGSIGLAFICWDIGMKKGDVAFLGVASYAAPVLSTVILVIAGYAPASWLLALSCVLIVVGALVASFGPAARSAAPKAVS